MRHGFQEDELLRNGSKKLSKSALSKELLNAVNKGLIDVENEVAPRNIKREIRKKSVREINEMLDIVSNKNIDRFEEKKSLPVQKSKKKKFSFDEWKPTPDVFDFSDVDDDELAKLEQRKAKLQREKEEKDNLNKMLASLDVVHSQKRQNIETFKDNNPGVNDKGARTIIAMKNKAKKVRASEKQQTYAERDKNLRFMRDKKRILQEMPELVVTKEEKKLSKVKKPRKRPGKQPTEEQQKQVPKYTREEIHSYRARKAEERNIKKSKKLSVQAVNELTKDEAKVEFDKLKNEIKPNKFKVQSLNVMSDHLDTIIGYDLTRGIEWIAEFVELLYVCLSSSTTLEHKEDYLRLFLRLNGVRYCESKTSIVFMRFIRDIFSSKKVQHFKTQAASDVLDAIGDNLEYVFESTFADAIKNLFISTAMMGLFNYSFSSKLYKHLGKLPSHLSTDVLVRMSVKSLAIVVRVVEDIGRGMPIHQAVFRKDRFAAAKMTVARLLFQKGYLYTGKATVGKYDPRKWLTDASSVLKYLYHRQKRTSAFKKKDTGDIDTLIAKMEEAKLEVIETINAGFRVAPFGVIIGKDPGIGKSTLVTFLATRLCYVKGYKFRHDLIYPVDLNSDFYDGLDNQVVYHYSEPGTQSKHLAKTKGDPKLMSITSVMDNLSKRMNMADLKKKDCTYAHPELIIADTNNFSMNLDDIVTNPAAFRRRFMYVEFIVKDEYRKDGSCELDGRKIHQNKPSHPLDIYRINCWFERAVSPSKTIKVDEQVNLNIFSFKEVFDQALRDHFQGQAYVEQNMGNGSFFGFPGDKPPPGPDNDASLNPDIGNGNDEGYDSDGDFGSEGSNTNGNVFTALANNIKRPYIKLADRIKDIVDYDSWKANKEEDDEIKFVLPRSHKEWLKLDENFELDSLGSLGYSYDEGDIALSKVYDQMKFDVISDIDDFSGDEKEIQGLEELNVVKTSSFKVESGKEAQAQLNTMMDDLKMELHNLENQPRGLFRGVQWVYCPRTYTSYIDKAIVTAFLSSHSGIPIIVYDTNMLADLQSIKYLTESGKFDEDFIARAEKDLKTDGFKITIKGRNYISLKRKLTRDDDPEKVVNYLRKKYSLPVILTDLEGIYEVDKISIEEDGLIYEDPCIKPLDDSPLEHKTNWRDSCDLLWRLLFIAMRFAWKYNWILFPFLFVLLLMVLSIMPLVLLALILAMSIYKHDLVGKTFFRLQRCFSISLSWLSWEGYDTPRMRLAMGLVGASAVGGILYKSLKKKHFTVESYTSPSVKTMEDLSGCEMGVKRININKIEDQWNVRSCPKTLSLHKGDPVELDVNVTQNKRFFRVVYTTVNKVPVSLTGYLLGIKECYALTAAHYFADMPDVVEIKISQHKNGLNKDLWHVCKLRKQDLYFIGEDLVVFSTLSLAFRDILKKFVTEDKASTGSASVGCKPTVASRLLSEICVDNDTTGKSYTLKKYYQYISRLGVGDCGTPGIMNTDGGAEIVFIHVAGGSGVSIGHPIYRYELECAMAKLSCVFVQCLSESPIIELSGPQNICVLDLEDPIPKSAFRHELFTELEYFGKLPGRVEADQTSKLVPTVFSKNPEYVDQFYEAFGEYPTEQYGRPKMAKFILNGMWESPYNIWLRKANKVPKALDRKIMSFIINHALEHIITKLRAVGIIKLAPFTFNEAINGVSGDAYFSRINVSTASGFGYPGKKSTHLPLLEPLETIRDLSPELTGEILRFNENVDNGVMTNFVYNASLKDEPRLVEKCALGKTRVFFITPLALLILSRVYLGPLYSTLVQHSEIFCSAVGINMHRQGGKFFEKLHAFSDFMMDGDWGGFDVTMPLDITVCSNTLLFKLAECLGYNNYALLRLRALLSTNIYVWVAMLKDVLVKKGLQPSGKYGTAEDNCIKSLFIFLYFWYSNSTLAQHDFFEKVLAYFFGDDFIASVKPEVAEYFNNVQVALWAKDNIGMDYTTASKGLVTNKFGEKLEVSFLKRRYRIHASGKGVAAIDINTIYKMLVWRQPSNFLSESEQMLATVDSCLRESFFLLDKYKYDKWRNYLLDVYTNKFGISDEAMKSFITYEYLNSYYFSMVDDEESMDSLSTEISEDESPFPEKEKSSLMQVEQLDRLSTQAKQGSEKLFRETLEQLLLEEKELSENMLVDMFPTMLWSDVVRSPEYISNEDVRVAANRHHDQQMHIEAVRMSIKHLQSAIARIRAEDRYKVEMNNEAAPSVGAIDSKNIEKNENLVDVEGTEHDMTDAGTEESFVRQSEFDLQKILQRPVMIFSSSITLDADFIATIRPWSLLLQNPTYVAKFRNMFYMHADLKIKVAISCTQFEYGTFMVGWIPYPEANDVSNFYTNTASAAYRFQKLQWLSQFRGTKVMRLHDNKPLEFDIPYVNYAPALRLSNPTAAANATALTAAANMGALIIMSLNQPTSTNATAPTAISMNVFANFENMKLSASTATQFVVTTESKNELVTGPIEKLSSSLAEAAGVLEDIPIIAPYAKASKTVFRALSLLASHYGFSVPVISSARHLASHIRPDGFQNAVTTSSVFMGKKLSFDPEQELTVDPRIVGVSEDEMSIAYIAAIPSLLDTFTWSTSATPMSTLMWQAFVTPHANKVGPVFSGRAFIQPTAASYAATPFQYWNCTMVYKFVFNKTIFHKGKIMIVFEPNTYQFSIIAATSHLNKQYILVVDIQETDTVEICVPFVFPRMWATAGGITNGNRSVGTSLVAATGASWNTMLGTIYCLPFTALQGPDGKPVQINVFTHAENLRVNGLISSQLPKRRATTQAMNELVADGMTCFVLGEQTMDTTKKTELHFGEQPMSFRSYLKRYVFTSTATLLSVPALSNVSMRQFAYPDPAPAWGGLADSNAELFGYLQYAFLGYRGSLRKRFKLTGANIYVGDQVMVAMNNPGSNTVSSGQTTDNTVPLSQMPHALFTPFTNSGVEVEIPHYTSNLFIPSGLTNTSLTAYSDPAYDSIWFRTYSIYCDVTAGSSAYTMNEFTSIGEDFNFLRFLSSPPFSTTNY